jgi:hypothetical protein
MDSMQHLILLIIILLTAGLAYVPVRWPGGLHMTFSQHAATDRWSKIYYLLLFSVTLPLLLWFFIAWLVPEKNLPAAFTWFAMVAVVFQIACAFTPEVGGRLTKIHRILTGISAFAMLPLVAMLALAPALSSFTRLVAASTLVVMLVLLTIALRHQRGHSKAMLLQIGYYAGFFIALLVATYIG